VNGKRARLCLTLAAAMGTAVAAGGAASAGPPFLTDDPEPTDTGHWEIYAPTAEATGRGGDYEGSFGAELNYGPAPNVQLTVGLPVAFVHDAAGDQVGRDDLRLSVKYRFFDDEASGVSIAVFPGVTLPTASHGLGAPRATALLPVWAQKDFGSWLVFGGGGYAINPGPGARNYWTGGVALARNVSKQLLAGVEIDRQGADTDDGRPSTSLGLGAILQLKPPFRLLASGGPTFLDGGGSPGFHAYLALGLNF
jgi:hypothetical protein